MSGGRRDLRRIRSQWCSVQCGLLLLGCLITGCSSYPSTARHRNAGVGTAVGAVGGSVLGGVIGHQFGSTVGGAVVGGLAGAGTGALVGHAADVGEERDYQIRQTRKYQAELDRRDFQMMSNRDVAAMARAGCSDRIIISTIMSRGGRFDLSPQQIIALQSYGVSDPVVETMQMYNQGPAYQ